MKPFIKQYSFLCSLHGKVGIQINNTVNTLKRKIDYFHLKKNLPPQKHSPQYNVYFTEYYRNFLKLNIFKKKRKKVPTKMCVKRRIEPP